MPGYLGLILDISVRINTEYRFSRKRLSLGVVYAHLRIVSDYQDVDNQQSHGVHWLDSNCPGGYLLHNHNVLF